MRKTRFAVNTNHKPTVLKTQYLIVSDLKKSNDCLSSFNLFFLIVACRDMKSTLIECKKRKNTSQKQLFSFLGIAKSKIRVVEIVRETSGRRRKRQAVGG